MSISYEQAIEESKKYFDGDDLAAKVFIDKYALRNENGDLLESTPDQAHRRLAKEFARIEKKYENPLSEEEIYEQFKGFKKIVPQGSPMSAIGNPYQIQSASNCFVIPSPKDSYGGILFSDQEQAQIMKRRGGVGFDISNIRPKGVNTKNAAKTTDGIGVFMERFSNTCREVAQNGRRGALMLTISCHHPEIMTFINIKKDKKKVTGANISIRLSDEFMKAVKNDTEVQLRWPVDSATPTVTKMIKAKEVWNEIVSAAWESAEPGILFWDNIINNGPADIYPEYRSVSTNPCVVGETLVYCADGRGNVSIKQLAEEGKDIDVFCYDNNGKIVIRKMRHPRVTGYNEKIYKVTFDDGNSIKCTSNHKIRMLDGTYKEVKDIKEGEQVKILTKFEASIKDIFPKAKSNSQDYYWLNDGRYINYSEHRLIAEHNNGNIDNFKNNSPKTFSDFRKKELGNVIELSHWAAQQCNLKNINCGPRLQQTLKDALDNGYIAEIIDNEVFVEKICEHCGNKFKISYFRREGAFCSKECNVKVLNSRKDTMEKRINSTQETYKNKLEVIRNKQLDLFSLLKFNLNREPMLKEFYVECQKIRLSCRFGTKNGFKNYNELKELASLHNHRVSKIEYIGNEDVYNGTVDDFHNFFIGGFEGIHTNQKHKSLYINNLNCGEITLSPYDSCRLMVVNLQSFVKNPFTDKAKFDYTDFAKTVQIAQRLMDDMIDIELEQIDKILNKIEKDPEDKNIKKIELDLWNNIKKACVNGRRTGLGITALGDALASLNIQYGSPESIKKTDAIYKSLAVNAEKSSCQMAKDRGAFPAFDRVLEKGHPFITRLLDQDEELASLYKKHGRRNISTTTTAPVGSVSMLTQTTSGIEPAFLLAYTRRKKILSSDTTTKASFVDAMGDKWQEFPVYHHGFEQWMKVTGKTKIEESPYNKSTSNEIDWIASVDIQAAAQKWISHSISKTCNLPSDATKEMVAQVYMRAWESGCKGFTVYRDKCRDGVLVETKKEVPITERIVKTQAPKRPKDLNCDVFHIKVKGQEYFVIVGLWEDGTPYEIFAGKNGIISKSVKHGTLTKKARGEYCCKFDDGSEACNIANFITDEQEAITRLASFGLRHGGDISFLVHQLEKTTGTLDSFAKVLVRVLKKYIKDGTKIFGETCKSCNSTNLIRVEGCLTCVDCGSSKCG